MAPALSNAVLKLDRVKAKYKQLRGDTGAGVKRFTCSEPGMHEIPHPRTLAETCAQWARMGRQIGAWRRAMRSAPPLAVAGWKSLVALGNLCAASGRHWTVWEGL